MSPDGFICQMVPRRPEDKKSENSRNIIGVKAFHIFNDLRPKELGNLIWPVNSLKFLFIFFCSLKFT